MKKYKDYSGEKWGKIIVIEKVGSKEFCGHKVALWRCMCDCGREIFLTSNQIRIHSPKSCGCSKERKPYNKNKESHLPDKEFIGKKYNKLTIIERFIDCDNKGQGRKWLCECECGNTIIVNTHNLINDKTKQCNKCSNESIKTSVTKHGYCQKERLYTTWLNMRDRCNNPNYLKYHLYGGRGIEVCESWNDYSEFKNWAIKNGYDDSLSLDRIDVNGNYDPNNCRWVTQKTQCNNKRCNHYITYNGVTKTAKEWSECTGIKYRTILSRINNLKWGIGKALGYE